MIGREQGDELLTEAQWDLLADYLGGALDDDPRRDEIAALIASDPGWQEAAALLTSATSAVEADLRLLASAPVEPMPGDVLARLDAALAAAGSPSGSAQVITLESRRRRIPRWAAPAAVAAGVVAFAAFGVPALLRSADGGAMESTVSAPGAASDAQVPITDQQILVSGTDYTAASARSTAERVAQLGAAAAAGSPFQNQPRDDAPLAASDNAAPPQPELTNDEQSTRVAAKVTGELARLADSDALETCLQAIASEHGTGETAVRLIDYASFGGSPGLLVFFTDSSARGWVWVAGPQCGVPGMGADTRYAAPVG